MQLKVRYNGQEEENYNHEGFPFYSKKGVLSLFNDYAALAHRHFDFELNLILEGRMDFFSQGVVYPLQKGDAIFVNSNSLHYGFSAKKEALFISQKFSPLLLSANDFFSKTIVFPFTHDRTHAYVFHQDKKVNNVIMVLNEEANKAEPDYSILMEKIYFLFSQLCQKVPLAESPQEEKETIALTKMVEYIGKDYASAITLNDIAREGMVTRNKACEIFRKNIQTTPNDYLLSVRLHHAMSAIEKGDKIADAAYSSGFSSSSYFTVCFQKKYGTKPMEIKKKIR